MALAGRTALGGGNYFKPENHLGDVALIIEPKSFRKDVPNQNGPRDEITADVTVFRSMPQLERGEPFDVLHGVRISQIKLVRDLKGAMDDGTRRGDTEIAVIQKIGQWRPPQGGNKVWVLQNLDEREYNLAAQYYDQREAKLAAGIAAAPDDFGDD